MDGVPDRPGVFYFFSACPVFLQRFFRNWKRDLTIFLRKTVQEIFCNVFFPYFLNIFFAFAIFQNNSNIFWRLIKKYGKNFERARKIRKPFLKKTYALKNIPEKFR